MGKEKPNDLIKVKIKGKDYYFTVEEYLALKK